MDSYIAAYIKVNVHVDAGGRVFCKNEELKVHVIGNEKKVVLPIGKIMYTFDDLKKAGARCDVITLFSLAKAGAEARWKEEIQTRRDNGLPSNVYIANARSIAYAIEKGRTPPTIKYLGRKRDQLTEVYDTVDEVVDAMSKDLWRKTFARGSKKRLHPK